MAKIEIPLSKTKLVLAICGSILFVILGAYLFTTLAAEQTRFDPVLVKGVGIAGMLFFGAAGIYGATKMFDKNIGLTIDENGIIDNTNASSIGLIKWADITEIEAIEISYTKFLLVHIRNPDDYLAKAKGFKRKLMEANNRIYETPVSITFTALNCRFDDLERILKDKFIEYGSPTV